MKILKRILISLVIILASLSLIITIAIIINNVKTDNLYDDYQNIYKDEKYQNKYVIDDVSLVKQEISCGYAVIEMFSKWEKSNVTEKQLFDEYGKVVTSTGDSFSKEMNKRFKSYNTTVYKYLKNSELIDKVYNSLKNNIPVPFEWAALHNDEWTLHYSLIYGIDIKNDLIYIKNPYGYDEKIKIGDFLDRTSFKAFKNMPFFYSLAFSFGIFEKNTIFIVENKE